MDNDGKAAYQAGRRLGAAWRLNKATAEQISQLRGLFEKWPRESLLPEVMKLLGIPGAIMAIVGKGNKDESAIFYEATGERVDNKTINHLSFITGFCEAALEPQPGGTS